MNLLQTTVATVARQRGITIAGLLSEVRLPKSSFYDFCAGREPTRPTLTKIVRLEKLCGFTTTRQIGEPLNFSNN